MTTRFNFLLAFFVGFTTLAGSASAQGLVINEVDVIPGDGEQFVELFGLPSSDLDGYSLALVKAQFLGGGVYEAQIYEALDLTGESLNEDGFVAFALPLNTTIAGVALYEADIESLVVGEAPPSDDVVDAIIYGNTSPGNPQAAVLLQAVMPAGSGLIYEGAEGNGQGQSISRFPNGGDAFDIDSYVLQAPTQGISNILACDGGYLEITNLANDTLCTDQGPAVATFNHFTDAPYALLTLLVVDPATGEIAVTANGSAVNFQGLGDGEFNVVAVSHDLPLVGSTIEVGQQLSGVIGEGCFSVSDFPFVVLCETCEVPACDGGTMLDASGAPEVLVCLSDDGTLVPFGYYSEAVEDDFLFAICNDDDEVLATTAEPYYDFTDLGADIYHVWGVSTQGDLDQTTVETGELVFNATALECDSVGASALQVTVMQCGDAGLCDDLIISEYVEGDSHNKAIEIHNPTPLTIDLAPYSVETYNNGATEPTQQLDLEGQLLPGGTFVIGNSQAVGAILNVSTVFSNVTWYNGNDAIVLRKNEEAIDIMGEIGEDPGEPWTVTTGGAMAEFTLVRKPNIGSGSTDWSEGMTQWDGYPQDTFDFLGDHSATCGGLGTMQIGFDFPELYVTEGGGVEVSMSPTYPLEDAVLKVSVAGGDAVVGVDYPDVFPLEFNFEMGLLNSQTFTFTAIDEEEPEIQEDVLLALSIVSGDVELGIDTMVVHILPSDLDYPVYEINQVRGVNPQGVLDSIGTACELRGIVHGWNDYPSGLQFTLIDETNGINAFSPVNDFGYDVVEGDSVRARGVIDQYLGLAQIRLDTLIYEGSGFDSEQPNLVFELDEETESRIIKLKCVELVNPAEWTNATPGFDVSITTGTQEILMRVDANTDLFGQPAPVGVFGVSGIGGQRDYNPPLVDGYTITPRGQFDLTEPVIADFIVVSPWDGSSGVVEVFNMSAGAGGYHWSMGDGETYTDDTPEHWYSESGTFTITLTAFSEDGECSSQATNDVISNWVSVEDFESGIGEALAYPNPTSSEQLIEFSGEGVEFIQIFDTKGSTILSNQIPKTNRVKLDFSSFEKGVYTLIAEGYSAIRIIVQ